MAVTQSNAFSLNVVAASSALTTAVAALGAGQSVLFHQNSNGFTSALLTVNSDNIFNYAQAGEWDSVNREVHFMGQGHIQAFRHIRYVESTNQWSLVSENPAGLYQTYGHAYRHMTLDSSGNVYWRNYNNSAFWRWNRSTYTQMANVPRLPNDITGALVWHPTWQRIVYAIQNNFYAYNPATNTWSSSLATVTGMGDYHIMGTYCAAQDVVVIGGGTGTSTLWRVSNTGVVTQMTNSPVGLDVEGNKITYCPAAGTLLVLTGTTTYYAYNFANNTWTTRTRTGTTWSGGNFTNDGVAVPLYGLGATMVMTYAGPSVWLFKGQGA